jgi:hypothetical protein
MLQFQIKQQLIPDFVWLLMKIDFRKIELEKLKLFGFLFIQK